MLLDRAVLQEVAVNPSDDAFGHIFLIYDNFKEFYHEIKTIGQGTSAVVKKCVGKSPNSPKEVAVKIINYNGDDERLLQVIST